MSDETTQSKPAEQTPDNSDNKATIQDTNGSQAQVPSSRLREEAEKRREAETALENYKLEETKRRDEAQKEKTKEVAVAKFGEDLVADEKVQEQLTKYPGMSYEDAIKLAGKEPKANNITPGWVGRNPNDLLKDDAQVSMDDLLKLTPEKRKLLYQKADAGEVRIVG